MMRTRISCTLGLMAGLVVALSVAPIARAQSGGPQSAQSADSQVTYVPPFRGIPGKRITGATRGAEPESNSQRLRVYTLAPDGVALTMQEQPTLYWYASRAVPAGAELELSEDSTGETVLTSKLPGPIAAGIHAVSLAGTTARLKTGETYTWTVTAIVSSTDPMKNEVASSQIERTSGVKLNGTPAGADANTAAAIYAKAGLWYEALDALSRGLQAAPTNKLLLRSRASLLTQVGLSAVAASDSLAAR